jgi:hypothetical protein
VTVDMEKVIYSFSSTKTKQEGEEAQFRYSWYLPVPPASEENAGSAPVDQLEAAEAEQKGVFGLHLNVPPSILRFAGLSGWNIASGVGIMVLFVFQSPVPVDRVAALGGVWAAVSALVWSLSGRLME